MTVKIRNPFATHARQRRGGPHPHKNEPRKGVRNEQRDLLTEAASGETCREISRSYLPALVDRSKWLPGPWDDEPDRVEWRYRGLPCLIVRGPMGNLCGYVGVGETHPWYRRDFLAIDPLGCLAHGGVDYTDVCAADGNVCHVPQPGEADAVWWIGFSCGHARDEVPGHAVLAGTPFVSQNETTYRTLDYVRSITECLADYALMQ